MNRAKRLAGKVAVVTGSTGGMGAGIANRLAADGASVVISGRRAEAGEQIVRELQQQGGQATFVRADVSVEADCVALISTTLERFGQLDILVNNAAITPEESAGQQSVELWDQVFDTNVRGAFLCCREAIPAMRAQGGGCVVNIGSTVPFRGHMDRLAYGCSKGALYFMTKMMARDLVQDHILVNWISVGWVATPGEVALRDQLSGDGLAYLADIGRTTPLGRLEFVEEIAAGVAYLVSDEASHITGCDLNISLAVYGFDLVEAHPLKITHLETHVVGNPWKNWVFVRVDTDEGLTGIGEATGGLSAKPGEAQVHELERFVIGEDPLQPERLYQRMYKGLFLGTNVGMCAIEIACWDILGKSLGVPLWKLLGGQQRPRLRVYANGWYQGPRDPVFFAEAAARVKEMGYTALKFDPFGAAYRALDRENEKLSLAIIRAVRASVGDEVDLCIEGHDRFSVSTAIRIGQQLEEFHPLWFETPVMSTDILATVAVAKAIRVPVASGERFQRLQEVADLASHRVVDILQPETLHIGGISGARKAAAVAESAEAFIALHQAQSPLNTAINAHIHASIPNFLIQECFDDFLVPWAHELMRGVPRVKDGYLEPSNAPGLGVELNEAELARHPYGPDHFMRLFEDGWETRRR